MCGSTKVSQNLWQYESIDIYILTSQSYIFLEPVRQFLERGLMHKGEWSKHALFWTASPLVKTSDQIIAMKPSKDRRGKHKKRKLPLRGKTRN